MSDYKIDVSDETALFYERIANNIGLSVENVMSDALFKFAGELSKKAIDNYNDQTKTTT